MQLQAWHEEVNEQRPSRAAGRVPGAVLRAEELDLRFPVRVGPTGMVAWETNRYSMPAEALGHAATLHLYRDRVVIEAGRYRAEHLRLCGRYRVSRLAAHRDGLLAAVSGKRGHMYLKRRQLLELGPHAERVLTELVHVRPRRWPDDVERLHELLQSCGSDALREAFREVARGARRLRGRHRPRSQRPRPPVRQPAGGAPVNAPAPAAAAPRETEPDELAALFKRLHLANAHRAETRLVRCVRKARFPLLKTVEEFDFSVQPELRRTLLGSCFSPEFVARGRNLILTGRSQPHVNRCRRVETMLGDVNGGGGVRLRDKSEGYLLATQAAVRHGGGENAIRALMQNVGTCHADGKGGPQPAETGSVPMRRTGAEQPAVARKVL